MSLSMLHSISHSMLHSVLHPIFHQEVPVQEEALLNGETVSEPVDDGLVNFMHDSQLDRSESQLSPHAPEFLPSSSPDIVEHPEKGTFTLLSLSLCYLFLFLVSLYLSFTTILSFL